MKIIKYVFFITLFSISTMKIEGASPAHMIQTNCYNLIQKEKYTEAVKEFKTALNNCIEDPSCAFFSIIVSGLIKAGYMNEKEFSIDVYSGVKSETKTFIRNLKNKNIIHVFQRIHEFCVSNPNFTISQIEEYFSRCFKGAKHFHEQR